MKPTPATRAAVLATLLASCAGAPIESRSVAVRASGLEQVWIEALGME